MINLKKELIIFFSLLVIVSIGIHFDAWINHPMEHMESLFSHSMAYHPFLYVFLIYLVIGFFRVIINLIKKLFKRK
ncbi:hypothetical protein CRV08_09170 [Halarcobacter ebronensis]|uniref:Uncharacterized protein n=1 Tax=Halarcobacter ebronensis TaxID=1462615 RepID=A0A4Q1APR5_9BACT|nr:hypothetical protein [Halarcobacter ebronensis]QKF80819.1 putative membrane protein [Halarcobacter ebronensis]RXJ67969.1 hypothetical protein CRV08_09170 [Halarcobacter ebronensis]RXK08609.1 hypothetical protein CRV07_02055 [Halarcobacter ebronensis]